MDKNLSNSVIFTGKNKKGTHQRPGFVNEAKQTFLPPKSPKRMEFWKKKMQELGYTFS